MVNDNAKVIVVNGKFEYQVEFKKIVKYQKCCDRGCMKIDIRVRNSKDIQFKGFTKRGETSGEKFKEFTYGEFCPICGTSFGIEKRARVNRYFGNWREALKDIDEAARKAWLSLQE